ncbi:MAG: TM0106 family RecB-like putative nuclease [Armatimonadota bacterium]|nr:TM0106 family RecB-like putative nuclease [Armatimonadota bacterium]MDR7534668.1 TM0106 family RecB-like putative nuclease [Armatimonadota bacterium]MDR7573962.1 TM0106 family RecB-like putative nuclease [Armatimonadota bacterium]
MVCSASDLVGFLACEHLTHLERAAAAGLVARPSRVDPELGLIRRRGVEHERRYLEDLAGTDQPVVTIDPDGYEADAGDGLRAAAEATIRAMAAGARSSTRPPSSTAPGGATPTSCRVESPHRPSRFGPYHYDVVDTKLARQVKAGAVLQLCSYVEQLTAVQGVQPEFMSIVLGGSSRAEVRLRVDDYLAYYRATKRRFEAVAGPHAAPPAYPPPTYPDPVEHCEVCRWSEVCAARRRAYDHTSLVAGITRRQRKALAGRGVTTLEALGELGLPVTPPLEGVSAEALARVREQARIQLAGRRRGEMLYELLHPPDGEAIDPERGLATLPEPSAGDLFLDLEGDPYAFEDGFDFLFGVLDGEGNYTPFWSRDADDEFSLAGEKRAFEALIDFLMARLARDPHFHVYHYAAYEPTAIKRLMGRHATREEEVDRLLRGGVLVDLYRAVRQSLRASVESYSIKQLEPLYGFARTVDLREAGSSLLVFAEWLELGEGERPGADHLNRIEAYNRDDVISARRLRDWLEERRVELAQETGLSVPRPAARSGEPPEELSLRQQRVAALAARLCEDVPVNPRDRSPEQQARWLLAQLLSWHRREDKSTWWEFFRLMSLTPEELVEERDPIGGLVPKGPVGLPSGRKQNRQVWRYEYPEQEHEIGPRTEVYDPALAQTDPTAAPSAWRIGRVVDVNLAQRTIDVERVMRPGADHPKVLVPLEYISTVVQQEALMRIGEWVAIRGLDGDGPYAAALDLLMRRPPRVGQAAGAPLRYSGEDVLTAARRLVLGLTRGVLAIQGPPGSGKTYTGARMISTLLRAGKTVGICANSHKVIGHLLVKTVEAAREEGVSVRAMQRVTDDEDFCGHPQVRQARDNRVVDEALAGCEVNLVGGTAWLWSREEMQGVLDVLFVDEAGQMSLANALAISHAAPVLVLLGDPQQLDQPLKGTHPPGADRSALAHLIGEAQTMPPERGLFLETTWRLHPDLCRFTSEAFYESRLQPQPHLAVQRLIAVTPLDGTGLRLIPVTHSGNDTESVEEAEEIARLARLLVEGESH